MSRIVLFFIAVVEVCFARGPVVNKIEPPNWWVGMRTNSVQLMLYGEALRGSRVRSLSPAITINRVHSLENSSYVFVDITITRNAKPGRYDLSITTTEGTTNVSYPLVARDTSGKRHQGFDEGDVIYLITPDRFANGDTTNDTIDGMSDGLNRSNHNGRHGGDIQGIINALPYLHDLGVTALWINPLVENNTPASSYHGYAATDLYRIDPRFGSNALFTELVRQAHARGLKIIMDHVNNHISIAHPWLKNLPTPDWLNGTREKHIKAFHSKVELDDIYSDSLTRLKAEDGWFAEYMPDLNQRNPFVANYLIYSTLWWIESSGIDGIREDTYPYIHPAFRERWCAAILREYPRFNIVGEVWVQEPVYLAPYQRGSFFPSRRDVQLPSITDFGLFDAFMKTFADSAGRIDHIFRTLTQDFLFPEPRKLVTFLDNHDVRRIAYVTSGDMNRVKLALLCLLTTRGIPQLFYGTEIGMTGGPDHGRLRAEFPGGFPGDARNTFTEAGRTAQENDIFNFTKQLLQLRKSTPALQRGSLVHFSPANNVYVYFRMLGNTCYMILLNRNTHPARVALYPYQHHLKDVVRLRDLLSGKEYDVSGEFALSLEALQGVVLQPVSESE